jgi:Phospholipid methyltransferase
MHTVELVFAIGRAAFWIYRFVAAFFHERVASFVPELVYQSGGRRLGDSLGSFGSIPKQRHQLGSVACWPRILPVRDRTGVRHLGPSPHRRQLGHTDVTKDEPELVTSGPYRLVRHPIYSGILLAVLGTARALSWLFLVALVLVGVYFTYSANVEERDLTEQFPGTYPEYRRSTKMLVPFFF